MQLRSTAVILVLVLCILIPAISAEDALDWYTKGQDAATVGNYALAITYYDNALALDTHYASAFAKKAVALNALGRYTEALTVSEQALAIKSDADATNARAFALFKLARYEESIAAYDQLFIVQTNRGDAYCNQGYAYYQVNKFNESVADYDRCTTLLPGNLDGWNQKGLVLMSMNRYEDALDAFNHCTQITTKNAQVWNNKGKALVGLQRYSEAMECYNKALGIEPNFAEAAQNKEAIRGLGQTYIVTGSATPTEVPVRFGTLTAPATTTPVVTQTSAGQTALPASGEVIQSVTETPVSKKTTYAPLSSLGAVSALIILGIAGIIQNRTRK